MVARLVRNKGESNKNKSRDLGQPGSSHSPAKAAALGIIGVSVAPASFTNPCNHFRTLQEILPEVTANSYFS